MKRGVVVLQRPLLSRPTLSGHGDRKDVVIVISISGSPSAVNVVPAKLFLVSHFGSKEALVRFTMEWWMTLLRHSETIVGLKHVVELARSGSYG